MQPSHLTTIVRGVCCIRKREYDRKVKSIVDRKPEKKSNNFGQLMHFPLFVFNEFSTLFMV